MARVTVEDCLENVENRFELVMIAARRARQLENPDVQTGVERKSDKPTVIALREIAKGLVNLADKEEARLRGFTTEDETV